VSRRAFIVSIVAIFAAGALMRSLWLRSDPPVVQSVGIVWHDEGAWVHNARNRALWGVWRTDEWNPVFIAPVFTGLEYAAFRTFGVGTWQARTVPVISGLAAIVFIVAGVQAAGGRRAAAIAGAIVATNYAFVMWNRAALMESTMTAFIVAAWAAYAMAERRPAWGLAAGVFAALAWFTKASAAFFIAALVIDAGFTWLQSMRSPDRSGERRAAWLTIAGLAAAGAAAALFFVGPHWREYQFYNWQMTVTRKPEYTLHAFIDRASWLPIVHDLFARMWLALAGAALATLGIAARWRTARPAERLLVLWVIVGLAELVVHDSGNVRRYVMFIPALAALAGLLAGSRDPILPPGLERTSAIGRAVGAALLLVLGYLAAGSITRTIFRASVEANDLHLAVRLGAAAAVAITAACLWRWNSWTRRLSSFVLTTPMVVTALVVGLSWNLYEFGVWAGSKRHVNYDASVALGRTLPPGTLVQGKLANGMALENRIRPLFIGNHFGNYDDRLRRSDVRYILTYDLPHIGIESSDGSGLIQGLLDASPGWREVATFDVDETPAPERAALIDKLGGKDPAHARD